MNKTFRVLTLVSVCWFAALTVHAASEVDQIIKRARAAVGSEAALKALKSIHYTGTLTTLASDDKGATSPVKVAIEVIFQHPYRQRIVTTSKNTIEITALDDYEAWRREQDAADPARWRMTLLAKDQIKRLRANTWENLAFYSGLESRRGTVIDLGKTVIDGKPCRKIAFDHGDGIVFTRYFDEATSRLVLTETETGVQIREEGEIIVAGLRFPRKVVSVNKLTDGTERTVTIEFERITLNETFADSLFSVPAVTP